MGHWALAHTAAWPVAVALTSPKHSHRLERYLIIVSIHPVMSLRFTTYMVREMASAIHVCS